MWKEVLVVGREGGRKSENGQIKDEDTAKELRMKAKGKTKRRLWKSGGKENLDILV